MDHSWRFPAGDELCPVCAAPHFPFCPPPPLPPHPFPYDLHPPPPPPPPEYHASFHPPPPPPPPPEYHVPFHPPPPPPMWAPPGPRPYELLDMEGPHKRMRVGEAPPFDPYGDGMPPPLPPGMVPVEGDRLLGLIRDHGRPPLPPGMLHGEPYPPPDRFGYGGGRGYPPPNYDNPYAQGGNFPDYEHAGKFTPAYERHALGSSFVPGGSQEGYFNHDHRYNRFQRSESPVAPPLPPPARFPEARSRYDSHSWHPEAHVPPPPPPPEPPVPSPAMPPLQAVKSLLFPIHSGSPAATACPPRSHTLHQAHLMPNANRYNGPIHNEVSGLAYQPHLEQHLGGGRQTQAQHSINNAKISVISACDLFKQPLRGSRPDHIVIILRGLPGFFTTAFMTHMAD